MFKKICSKCSDTKLITQFSKCKNSQDGYQGYCKICVNTYNKTYHQSDKGKQAQKRYDMSTKGKRKARRYNRSDKGRQKYVRFRQSDKGQQSRKQDEAIRRTRETQAGGGYSISQWFNLCEFYDFHCLSCRQRLPFKRLTVDHIKPVSKGGSSFIWNLQPLCETCNKSKGNKEIDYRKTLPNWINRDGPVWQQNALFKMRY